MRTFARPIALLALCLAGASLAPAATYYILPDGTGDAPTIQAGLDLCVTGDQVLVAEGVYLENLVWPAVDGITLVSESGAETTAIDGGRLGSVITVATGVGRTTRIEGFTIRNGLAENGGGVLCRDGSSPTITGNTVTGNEANILGGGIACLDGADALIMGNVITQNTVTPPPAFTGGAGIAARMASPAIYDNLITYNAGGGGGGGINVGAQSSARVVNNTLEHNTSYIGGGIIAYHCTGYIAYNTIRHNTANSDGGGINCWSSKAQILRNEITFNAADGADCGGGISFYMADSSSVDNCIITDNTISFAEGGGLQCLPTTAPVIRNCTIADNDGCGVFCRASGEVGVPGGNPLIIHNNISGHPQHGVCNSDDRLMIDARENWWGDASGPGGSGPGTGDPVNQYVAYDPWAVEPFTVVLGADPQLPPAGIELAQNVPNPFNPLTRIEFSLPASMSVRLTVHDVRGRLVATLADGELPAGRQEVVWQARDDAGRAVAAGAYFYVLRTDRGVTTRKMCVVK